MFYNIFDQIYSIRQIVRQKITDIPLSCEKPWIGHGFGFSRLNKGLNILLLLRLHIKKRNNKKVTEGLIFQVVQVQIHDFHSSILGNSFPPTLHEKL